MCTLLQTLEPRLGRLGEKGISKAGNSGKRQKKLGQHPLGEKGISRGNNRKREKKLVQHLLGEKGISRGNSGKREKELVRHLQSNGEV